MKNSVYMYGDSAELIYYAQKISKLIANGNGVTSVFISAKSAELQQDNEKVAVQFEP